MDVVDRFLRDGARRFVFEGSECGGHVGPRASFPLWETQIERLLAFGDDQHARQGSFYEKLEVLFAGGIHDERSAAMVAAMVAPLVERGAAAGLVMGTASVPNLTSSSPRTASMAAFAITATSWLFPRPRRTSRGASACRTPRGTARRSACTGWPRSSTCPSSPWSIRPAPTPARRPRSAVRPRRSQRPSRR